jgi:membrane protease YdiL (CAAX protease family)
LTKRYWWVLITYIIALFSVIALAPLLYIITPIDKYEAMIYGNMIGFVLGLVVVLLILKPEMRYNQVRDASTVTETIMWSILGVFMAFISQTIAGMIEIYVFGIKTTSENTQVLMNITRAVPLFMIVTALIAPILEEIVFRKIIFGTLYKRTNFFIAGLISALIFGFIHGEPEHILIYASMGFVFAFLYVKTKRIIVPIIAHMAMNSIVVITQYSLTPEDIEKIQRDLEQMQIFIGG